MKKIVVIILCWIAATCLVQAQNAQRAEALFTSGAYADALTIYTSLHRMDARNVLYTYRMARCEQEIGMVEEAIAHFREAGERYQLRNLYLGDLCYQTYRFEEAKECYEAYIDATGEDNERYSYVDAQLRRTDRALRYYKRVEDVAIYDSVVFDYDTTASLISMLPSLSSDFGKLEATDGLYRYTNQRGDRRFVTILTDGQLRICKQERLLDTWTEPEMLPASINQGEVNYPFLMADGVTLYYAARSTNGLGGWDIYKTRFNPSSNSYLTPEMVGMPYNSMGNDLFLFIDETAGIGYFFSDRNADDHTIVRYAFRPNDSFLLLREEDDYIRDFVRLKVLRQPKQEAANEDDEPGRSTIVMAEIPTVEPDFAIVINDSTVYHHVSDFPTEEGREMAAAYLDLIEQIDEEKQELLLKREEYRNAESAAEKKTLTPLILSLEKDVARLKKEASHMLREIRQSQQ